MAASHGGGTVVVLHDLTPVHKLEHNIHRLDRLANIGTLSASLAHEIKNALVAVRTFVDILLEKNQDAELAEVVSREMKRINSLISQMLRVAHPARQVFGTVRVHELLEQCLRLMRHPVQEKLIKVTRHFEAQTDVITGNEFQLEQAFMNLLLNALEAMGPNGELHISTRVLTAESSDPARLHICFRDTGIGIPPENMGRLFDTFFTTKKNGTGLGLSITRRIIEEHHGEVTVESEINRGTIFCVTLPLAG